MDNKVAVGSIPKKIVYTYSDEREVSVGSQWDISWHDPNNQVEKVFPTYPTDDNPISLNKAKEWASQKIYDYATKLYINRSDVKVDSFDNDPILGSDIKILSLEIRNQGGRSYKTLIKNKYYVDLREDVLLDTMLKTGISPGGYLQGEFVWAKMHGQTKLVRVGSELHRLITEFEIKKNIKPVKKNDLEIGGLYQDKKKNKAIFLGYINTTLYDQKKGAYKSEYKADFKFTTKFLKKNMLFYNISNYNVLDQEIANFKHCLTTAHKTDSDWSLVIKKTHLFIEKIDNVDVPNNITDLLKAKFMHEIKECILQYTGHNKNKKITDKDLEYNISAWSKFLNVYTYGETPTDLFDVKKFLLFQ